MSDDLVDNWLSHFGVKGMRWGHRKAQDGGGDSNESSKPKKLTRKEVRAEKKEFYLKKADDVVRTAAAQPESLIRTLAYDPISGYNRQVVMTGKELVDHLAKGGYMNAKYTDVYATKDANSQEYVLNPNLGQKYRRSDKPKK